ncbi:S41 family peptidase [Aquabacterium sp.]|uniref:S41 family peptidase n=1 Tax=Aquabacterium sp. TaxID=1872578 RepID=UPI003782FF78
MPEHLLHRWLLRGLLTLSMIVQLPATAQPLNGFYRFPALHQQGVWFTAEGDLWRVGLDGGRAERITTHPGYETHPAVSPDGRWLAFVGAYEGAPDAYVMPAAGGTPKRLSWFGRQVQVWGWTPGGEVLATGPADNGAPQTRLYAFDPSTGRQRTLPLGQASDGAVSADGRTLYFTRGGLRGDNARHYRGGATARLWQLNLADNTAEARPLVEHEANHLRPMPYGSGTAARIAFLSDRDGRVNLWSVNAAGGDLRQHTRQRDFDIRFAAIDGSRVVYALGADLYLHDLADDRERRLDIVLGGDFDHQRTRWLAKPQDYLSEVALAPDGERVALTVRGRVATVGPAGLRRAEAPLPPEARCREGQFSHDSRHVYALCDLSPQQEVEVWRLPANGIGTPLQITRGATTQRLRLWPSPNGQWLAHLDKLVDGNGGLDREATVVWSPDSRLLAYVRSTAPNIHDQLYLHQVGAGDAPGRTERLTSDRYDVRAPAFTPDGLWLYFISDRHFEAAVGHPWGDRDMGPFFDKRGRVYALALQPGARFPFLPRTELDAPVKAPPAASAASAASAAGAAKPVAGGTATKSTAAPPPAVVLEGLARRLYQVPLPPGNYTALRTDGKRLYLLEREGPGDSKTSLRTLAIENTDPKPELFAADVKDFALTPDGKKLLVQRGNGEILLLEPGARMPADTARAVVRWTDWPIAVEPRAEWRQMFADAWRLHRDHVYDPRLQGVDWAAMRHRYEPLVERVTDRAELNELLAQMVGEVGLLHSQVYTPDLRGGPDRIGLAGLGARFEPVAQGLRVASIYRGDPELPDQAAPLAAPGVDVRVGDIVTAVDGRSTQGQPAIAPMLRGVAGRQVLLSLLRADGSTPQAVVTPVDAQREAALRYADWETRRGERTLQASQGRIGYLHLRAMLGRDIASFAREFYAHIQREGLIIDVRGNNGGNIDSWIIEKLLRRVWAYWQPRSPAGAPPYGNMQQTFRGQLVVLVNEQTYSDGETFAAGVQRLKLGTLIGRRTSGAGVWLSDSNRLLDNGLARAAETGQFTPEGEWLIEGRGVSPDIEVDERPRASFEGTDAQLEAAIGHLMQRITETPLKPPRLPAYPVLR